MKKLFCLLLSAVMAFSLVACGDSGSGSAGGSAGGNSANPPTGV